MDVAAQVARYVDEAKALRREQQARSESSTRRPENLPPLTRDLLDHLAAETAALALHKPPLAYRLAALADQAAAQQDDLHLQALAAFNLARAANAWIRPRHVWDAAERAQRLFRDLNEPGWAAASAWQRFAIPWACNNFRQAAQTLEEALAGLKEPEMVQWQVECRLALGFARLLLAQYDPALSHIEQCEKHYRQAADDAGLAQAMTSKAACLRRQSRFDGAEAAANEALHLLAPLDRPLDLARANFQLGHILVLRGKEYGRAEDHLQEALRLFTSGDVALWAAQCHHALARLFRETGRVTQSGTALHQARQTFDRFPLLGLRADTLVDSAVFALRTGDAHRALDYLAQAQPLYGQLGVTSMVAFSEIYRGEAYAELGRYQLALRHLEMAYDRLRDLNRPDGVAETALRLGEVWMWLERPSQALTYLQEARSYFEHVGHTSFLAEIYSLITAARLRNGDDVTEIIKAAQRTLDRLAAHDVRPYLALLQRFIGEAYLEIGRVQEAVAHLHAALEKFEQMNLQVEVAECCLPLGRCYQALSRPEDATAAWRRALDLSEASLPHIGWQAHAGIAQLAADAAYTMQALDHYAAMITAFGRLRRWLWQPSLAGSYLQRAADALDRAVLLGSVQALPLALQFVEESKAQTVARGLRHPPQQNIPARADPELKALAEEIRWLQQEIRAARHSDEPATTWITRQRRLVENIQRYDTLADRSARQVQDDEEATFAGGDFQLQAFRNAARSAVGDQWRALDYYLAGETLVTVILSDRELTIRHSALPLRAQRALSLLTRSRPTAGANLDESLEELARWLWPPGFLRDLDPGITLIISPHRRLHRLPWAALPGEPGEPLVSRCIPVITPSLHTFTLLQQRHARAANRRHGCVVAVSDFGERHTPLPETKQEVGALTPHMNDRSLLLHEEQATWEALHTLGAVGGLAQHAFLHVASHAFYDAVTGRASGLALHDRDIWLDELWELAPLPALVSFSACSGMQSYLYEGDEPIGLASTCLQAGAQHVVGSLWPVGDRDASALTADFYAHYFNGATPPQALTLAQRQAITQGIPWRCWAPFICVGSA